MQRRPRTRQGGRHNPQSLVHSGARISWGEDTELWGGWETDYMERQSEANKHCSVFRLHLFVTSPRLFPFSQFTLCTYLIRIKNLFLTYISTTEETTWYRSPVHLH